MRVWVTILTRKSQPHSCKQCKASSWLVPPPRNTLEQARFIISSTRECGCVEGIGREGRQRDKHGTKVRDIKWWQQQNPHTKLAGCHIWIKEEWMKNQLMEKKEREGTNSSPGRRFWGGTHSKEAKPSRPCAGQTGRLDAPAALECLPGTAARCWCAWPSPKTAHTLRIWRDGGVTHETRASVLMWVVVW